MGGQTKNYYRTGNSTHAATNAAARNAFSKFFTNTAHRTAYSYEQLKTMDEINPMMPMQDVAIVIGANDVVNPAASSDKSSPIYGMPIIKANEARTVFVLKRGKGKGFSGIENELFTLPNTRMIYGDAKATISSLVSEFGKE